LLTKLENPLTEYAEQHSKLVKWRLLTIFLNKSTLC
jgi:hypothetical protein